MLVGLLALPLACTTTIVPPAVDGPAVHVALLDHGRHASMVLPEADGRMTRWAYGERAWYAENRTGLLRAAAALLWPTSAALGRRQLDGPVDEPNIRQRVHVPIEAIWIIPVTPARAQTLRRELDERYHQQIDTRVTNPVYDLDFVDHAERYSYFCNSNHKVAEWLSDLGCEVRGSAYTSSWHVESSNAAE
jgi:hypothetical protein